MTLLITLFAAITFTIIWYLRMPDDKLKTGFPALIYWGASLMWLVDSIFEYKENGSAFFTPEAKDMLNDAFLGFSAVALGLIIWVIYLIIKDPRNVLRRKSV